MSSLRSRRTPTPAEHYRLLTTALADVAEQSFFACAEPCEAGVFLERAAAADGWLRASVGFEGAFSGSVSCTLPETLALGLFEAFIGLADPERPADALVFDLLGELGNMICGAWLTRTAERRQFRLYRPEVQRLRRPRFVFGHPDGAQPLLLNDEPMTVRLVFAPCLG